MGSDKGLIKNNEKTWTEHIVEKFNALHIPVIISINESQQQSYGNIFQQEQLVIDSIDIKGPLTGLLSVHQQYPSEDILLMACDLIDMDEATLRDLIDYYNNRDGFDFYVYHQDFAEPFCAIYTARGLRTVLEKVRMHSLLKFSFQNVLDEGNTFRIQNYNRSSFKNYNTIPGHHQERN
jgi:molybdopterin-guanine dinucleotide biosynthesis protein A